MTDLLNTFQKELLDLLQQGIEICSRPYEGLSRQLGSTESEVLGEIARLKKAGFIRRFRGQVHYRALGRVATLVAAEVPAGKLDRVIAAVNALPGVSHNYLREHVYNLWFTLQDESFERIDKTLSELTTKHDVVFYSLPAERVFKLDVRFDLADNPVKTKQTLHAVGGGKAIELTDLEKRVLAFVQQDFPLVEDPFAKAEGLDEQVCLRAVQSLHEKGVLKRIAAVVNHVMLGYKANVMFCGQAAAGQVESVGTALVAYRQVSHCYLRRTFPGWPYNLFAMIHAHSDELLETWIKDFVHTLGIREYALLRTVRELKKEPVVLNF